MSVDFLLRVGNGENLKNSSKFGIWGIKSSRNKGFLTNVKEGDRLWFVTHNSKGKILAVATYRSHNTRELGPLLNITMTNEQLGWPEEGLDWTSDTEIHYSDLYGLEACELLTHIKGQTTIRKYDLNCQVDLPLEYGYIVRYSKVNFEL